MKIVRPISIDDGVFVSSTVTEDDYAAWSAATVYALAGRAIVTSNHRVYESLVASIGGTATMTIASPCVVTWPGGVAPAADTPCQFSTTGALPTGLVAGTIYYVKSPSGGTSNLAATVGGAAINTSGSQSGVHSVVASANVARDPTDAANAASWLEVGRTNRWKMFDGSVNSQTQKLDSIVVELVPGERVNSLALLNVDAAEISVTVTDADEGEVYSDTENMVSDSGITDWYAYFFEPIVRRDTLVLTDLPPYPSATIEVTLTGGAGETVACGELLLGLSRDIGYAQYGTRLGIQDYSVKDQDDFGNYTIVERSFSRRAAFPVWVEAAFTDELMRLLSRYRATPVLYVGMDHILSSVIYGFYKDFEVVIESAPKSLCNLEIEGLT